jgi:hypothetical protein
VPHARAPHRELVTTAEVMLKTVRPHQKTLVAAGFSRAFFSEFRERTRDLRRIATSSSARQTKLTRVREAIREELATANETLGILDGLVLSRADRHPRFAKIWKEATRTPKPRGRPRAKKQKLPPNVSPVRYS